MPADDFVLLLCAAQQWRVFVAERTEEWLRAAGDNADRLDLEREPHNPTPNFIHCRWVPTAGGMERGVRSTDSETCWDVVPKDWDGVPQGGVAAA